MYHPLLVCATILVILSYGYEWYKTCRKHPPIVGFGLLFYLAVIVVFALHRRVPGWFNVAVILITFILLYHHNYYEHEEENDDNRDKLLMNITMFLLIIMTISHFGL